MRRRQEAPVGRRAQPREERRVGPFRVEPYRAVGRARDDGHAGALGGELEGVEELVDDVVALDLLGRRILFLRILRFSEFFWERERKVEKEEGKSVFFPRKLFLPSFSQVPAAARFAGSISAGSLRSSISLHSPLFQREGEREGKEATERPTQTALSPSEEKNSRREKKLTRRVMCVLDLPTNSKPSLLAASARATSSGEGPW